MGLIKRITPQDTPEELASRAERCAARLMDALAIARRRASRSSPVVKKALASAQVVGLSPSATTKTAAITFYAAPLNGAFHLIWGWDQVEEFTRSDLAAQLSHGVRQRLREFNAR